MTLPQGFHIQPVRGWQRLAIGTDGVVPDVLPQVWDITHERGLQRKMNVWASLERRFRDDATLITMEHTPSVESNPSFEP
ncbi:hypothetical protein HC776_03000 [bacterium]|nr:hypothetical protein [bacterium]